MLSDFRLAIRQLLKSPGYTALAVIALALGIGANTAIFSAIECLFLRPLAYDHSSELVRVAASMADRGLPKMAVSYPKYLELVHEQRAFTDVAIFANTGLTLTGRGEPEQVNATRVSANFFSVLGIRPFLGRAIAPEEDRPGGTPVVLVSYAYWQSRLGGDPAVIGQSLTLNGVAVTVIGIMPKVAEIPFDQVQMYLAKPFEVEGLPREIIEKGSGYLFAIGRLRPGVAIDQANDEFRLINTHYATAFPDKVDASAGLFCLSLHEDLVGNQKPLFLVLLATVGFVLVIACSNVANLLLARFSRRRKEIAVRTALGASRGAIIRQFLAESLLTSLLAGALGLLVTVWGVAVLGKIGNDLAAGANAIPRLAGLSIDPWVLLFSLGISVLTGLGLGLVPAIQASKADAAEALKESTRGSTGGRSVGRFRAGLLITEVALSLVLLVGAGLLIGSFRQLQKVDPGFDPRKISLINLSLPQGRYGTPERVSEFWHQAIEELKTIPGVADAGGSDSVPLSGGSAFAPYGVEGRPLPPTTGRPLALRPLISPGYFATLGVPMRLGRDFTWQDNFGSKKVIIINEALAKKIFPNGDAIGHRLITGILQVPREIVGVVANMRSLAVSLAPQEEMYYPTAQLGDDFFTLIVRSDRPARSLGKEMTAAIHHLDAGIPVPEPQPLTDLVSQNLAAAQLGTGLLSGFAGLSLLLAGMGIYTVIAYTVTQRTNEIGIRMALGAEPRAVFLMVMGQGMRLALIGLAVGLGVTLALSRLIDSLLFSVSAYDPWVLGGVSLFLALIAALACAIPAWRAVRIDPIAALRADP